MAPDGVAITAAACGAQRAAQGDAGTSFHELTWHSMQTARQTHTHTHYKLYLQGSYVREAPLLLSYKKPIPPWIPPGLTFKVVTRTSLQKKVQLTHSPQ